jgi:hypothetical protein
MMDDKVFIEVNCQQKHIEGERICGDVFLSAKLREEGRVVIVLSDGMGHGVKANVLATLTATMALNFTKEHKAPERIAEIIMNTLPVCSERKMSYSTFTIIDIIQDGQTTLIEYDNPRTLIMRGERVQDLWWTQVIMNTEKNKGKEIQICSFTPQKEDRIILCSDGVTQSGLGTEKYPFGWGREKLQEYLVDQVKLNKAISARRLASRVVAASYKNDHYEAKDDTSCAVVYFRKPRKLLICTGPPFEQDKDTELAKMVTEFEGKKILCGATTSDIIARELNKKITDSFEFTDPELPPTSSMDGIDLITEGILTLSKVSKILNEYHDNYAIGKGPADQIVRMLRESDEIDFIIGTRINIAHQDPNLPVELEIRRTVVRRIARALEEKFLKQVSMKFI